VATIYLQLIQNSENMTIIFISQTYKRTFCEKIWTY